MRGRHGGTFIEMVFNHPTLGEVFKYAAYDALATMVRRRTPCG